MIYHCKYWLLNLPFSYLLPSSTPFPTQEKNYSSTLQRREAKSQTLNGRKFEQLKLLFANSLSASLCNAVHSTLHLFCRPQENTAFIPPQLKPTSFKGGGVWLSLPTSLGGTGSEALFLRKQTVIFMAHIVLPLHFIVKISVPVSNDKFKVCIKFI